MNNDNLPQSSIELKLNTFILLVLRFGGFNLYLRWIIYRNKSVIDASLKCNSHKKKSLFPWYGWTQHESVLQTTSYFFRHGIFSHRQKCLAHFWRSPKTRKFRFDCKHAFQLVCLMSWIRLEVVVINWKINVDTIKGFKRNHGEK